MKNSTLNATCLLFACTVALIPSVTLAQSSTSGDQTNVFNRASNGDQSGLMQLINQYQINKNNDPNYTNTQREQLNSATEDFRANRLRMLRERSKKSNPVPAARPQ